LLPLAHLFAEAAGPAVVCLAADDLARDLVDDDTLAELVEVDDVMGVILVRAGFAVDTLYVFQEVFDCCSEGLVGRAGDELERFDHVGMHRFRRVGGEVRQPIGGWEVVPCHRGIAMEGWYHVRRIFP